MKRIGFLIEKIADIDNLRLAFWKARKGKSYANEVEVYRQNLDKNLLALQAELLSGEVKVGNYRYFKIYEPKERQICASAFSEQVLHHAMMNVCHQYFEAYQINESYASRKEKGTYAAIEKAKAHTAQYDFYLKLDVKKFFEFITHEVMKAQLRRMFKDGKVIQIFDSVIDSYAVGNANAVKRYRQSWRSDRKSDEPIFCQSLFGGLRPFYKRKFRRKVLHSLHGRYGVVAQR